MKSLKICFLLWYVLFSFGKAEALITRTYTFNIKINDIKTMRIITPGIANGQISLLLFASQAGASVTSSPRSTDSHSWLQFTSIAPDQTFRKIQVSITNGNIPRGTILTLSAIQCTTGAGVRGTTATSTDPILLKRNETKPLVTGIGSCYTGISATTPYSGYNLIYSFMPDPNNLGAITSFTNNIVTVTFTIINE